MASDLANNELDPLLDEKSIATKPILYRRRFLQLFTYFLLQFVLGFIQNTFPPVQDVIKEVYSKTSFQVNFLALMGVMANIPFSFISGFTLDRLGLRKTLLFFSALPVVVSGWVSYAGAGNFYTLLFGQMIAAIGSPFGLACSALLSEKWFSENERSLSTAVGGLAPIIGGVCASIVTPMFFTAGASQEQSAADVKRLMMCVAIAESVMLLFVFTLKDEPPTPPSLSAAEEKAHAGEKKLTLAETIAIPLKNYHFIMLMVVFLLGYGAINALQAIINQTLSPIGYLDNDIGIIGAALGTGVLGALVFGAIMDITKAYLKLLRVCALAAALGLLGFILSAYLDPVPTHKWLLFTTLGGLGFFGVPLVPLIIEMGVETLFPLSEGVATGFLFLAANLGSLILTLTTTLLQEPCTDQIVAGREKCVFAPTSMLHALILLGACYGVAVIAGMFFHGPMLRLEYERSKHRAIDEETIN